VRSAFADDDILCTPAANVEAGTNGKRGNPGAAERQRIKERFATERHEISRKNGKDFEPSSICLFSLKFRVLPWLMIVRGRRNF
jgi:hypothetical protein